MLEAGTFPNGTSPPARLERWGQRLLTAGFIGSLVVVLLLAWNAYELLFVVPLLVLGAAGVVYLVQHPFANLVFVVGAFVLITGHSEGLQAGEVLYGLYALGYMALWLVVHLFFQRTPIFTAPEPIFLFVFIVGATLTLPITIVQNGWMGAMFSEWVALLMLAIFFPVRHAMIHYRHAPRVLLGLLIWLGVFVTLRNLFEYQTDLNQAEYAWQVTRNRVITNDHILMLVSQASLMLLVFANRWRDRAFMLGCFLIVFAGLILTLSRGFWASFVIGAGLMFVLIDRRYKIRFATLVLVGLAGSLSIGFLFFADLMTLILSGLLDRLMSLLSPSVTSDISLVNRFHEARGAWERIAVNPILGNGMGVPFRFYDITESFTTVKTFIHNGFVSLWYRFGLWGLGLIVGLWGLAIWRGIQAFRTRQIALPIRLCGLIAAISLSSYTLSANTSNPFFHDDSLFMFGLLTGLASGAAAHARAFTHRTQEAGA